MRVPIGRVEIGRIVVSGIAAASADRIGPAIERALAAAVAQGRLAPGRRASLQLRLPASATAHDVAAALAHALRAPR